MGFDVGWVTVEKDQHWLTDNLLIEGPADPLVPHGTASGDLPFLPRSYIAVQTRHCYPVT